ncbi:MAG TPA: hypothetical protein VG937_37640 [Polyangiaceae bacterium]|nr:hypothetical protein [Polyangiaceae bacterium]
MTAACASSARAEGDSGLVLETGSPDALCPDLAQARAAVSRRLGALEVAGRRGFRARYTVGHAPEGSPRDFVRLELFDSEGARELIRDLPMNGESCSTMAEAIALVLDRHFRGLSPEESAVFGAGEATPEPARPAAKRAETPIASRAEAPSDVPQSQAPAPPPESSRADAFGTLLFAEFALAPSRPAAVGARLLTGLGQTFAIGGALLFDAGYERESLERGGEARAYGAELRTSLAWRLGNAPWFGTVGPSVALRLQRGETRELPEHSDQLRALWAGGLEAGGGLRVSRRFALSLSASALATVKPLSGHFYVSDAEVLTPNLLQVQVGLGAGYAF